ncbi:MAG TPA: response regulator transcription factor [Bacillota bacterium]|nr:response regulator transcription factor [Bacillota bacterium]
MRQPVILVIEDDRHILELLKVCLGQEGYKVVTEENGIQGLARAKQGGWDLIILDLMLPGMDGLTICKELSAKDFSVPILILTAKGEEFDRVLGLKLGADDYVVKPFSPRELAARVEAILRRVGKTASALEEIQFSELRINPSLRVTTINDNKVLLTPKEFDILYLLASHPGRVFTRDELLNRIWGFDYLGGSRAIDEHIKNIRQKIKEAGAHYTYIQTVWGVGYKFEELAP